MIRRLLTVAALLPFCLAATPVARAQTDNRALAEELLLLTNVEGNLEQIREKMLGMLTTMARLNEVPQDHRAEVEAFQQDIVDMIAEGMSWEATKSKYIDLYVEVFTTEELKGLIAFYKTPVGQSSIEKMPLLVQRSMELGEQEAMALMPKLRERLEVFRKTIE